MPRPYAVHRCGLRITAQPGPWDLIDVSPDTVHLLLLAIRGRPCPRCERVLADRDFTATGFHRFESRRVPWKPWTWLREPVRVPVGEEHRREVTP